MSREDAMQHESADDSEVVSEPQPAILEKMASEQKPETKWRLPEGTLEWGVTMLEIIEENFKSMTNHVKSGRKRSSEC